MGHVTNTKLKAGAAKSKTTGKTETHNSDHPGKGGPGKAKDLSAGHDPPAKTITGSPKGSLSSDSSSSLIQLGESEATLLDESASRH